MWTCHSNPKSLGVKHTGPKLIHVFSNFCVFLGRYFRKYRSRVQHFRVQSPGPGSSDSRMPLCSAVIACVNIWRCIVASSFKPAFQCSFIYPQEEKETHEINIICRLIVILSFRTHLSNIWSNGSTHSTKCRTKTQSKWPYMSRVGLKWVKGMGMLYYSNRKLAKLSLAYLSLCYVTLHYVILDYVTLRYVTLCYVTLDYVTLRYVTLSYLILSCLVLSCLVLSCLVLSCLVLSCLVFSYLILSYLICIAQSYLWCIKKWDL